MWGRYRDLGVEWVERVLWVQGGDQRSAKDWSDMGKSGWGGLNVNEWDQLETKGWFEETADLYVKTDPGLWQHTSLDDSGIRVSGCKRQLTFTD